MGGAQMYLRNKCLYMKEQGWEVDLVSAQKGRIYISELKQYSWFIPEIGFDYYLFDSPKRERIINEICARLFSQKYEDIVIESTCIPECTWGEVVSERIRARHLCFILQEYNEVTSIVKQNFLQFKYNRHELAGIIEQSLFNLFSSFSPIPLEKSYSLPAHCNNVVEDKENIDFDFIDYHKYDYTVGCVSRIDKPFIHPALNDFIVYARQHQDKKYLLLIVGGAEEGTAYEKNIRKLFKSVNNVTLVITGYIYPIPSSLLNSCDAFFSSSGSALVCMRSGVPTICYDASDFRPIGILGRTTDSPLFRASNEPVQNLSILLDEILEEKKYRKEFPTYELCKPDFSSHDQFISEMAKNKEYYSFKNISLNKSETKLKILLKIFGAETYKKMGTWKKRMLNHGTSDR